MDTTHIVRIPGQFNLPAGWPTIEVADITSGLFVHYNSDDLSGVGANGEVTYWPSRTSIGNLVLSSASKPLWRDLGNGQSNVSFISTASQWLHSEPLLVPRSGPVTFALVFRCTPAGTSLLRHRFLTTSVSGAGWFGISYIQETNVVVAETNGSGDLRVPLAPTDYAVAVAVFDGANSSLTVNGMTAKGTLNTVSSVVSAIRMGSNSSGSQTANGRIAELRGYGRALNPPEVQALTAELRSTHRI